MLSLFHKLGLPLNASVHGPAIDQMIVLTHWLMAALFIGWGAFFIYALVRFRGGNNPKASYTGVTSHFSSYLEAAVAVVEVVLLVGFSIPVWSQVVGTAPKESEATVIRVVAEQFAWNIHYPGADGRFGRTDIQFMDPKSNPVGLDPADSAGRDDLTTVNQLNVPVNTQILIKLSSKDVIHSFTLLQMRIRQDAVPGMVIPVHFEANQVSPSTDPNDQRHWEISCAQLCGLGHYRMRGFFNVLSKEDYAKWIADLAAAKALEQGQSGGEEVW